MQIPTKALPHFSYGMGLRTTAHIHAPHRSSKSAGHADSGQPGAGMTNTRKGGMNHGTVRIRVRGPKRSRSEDRRSGQAVLCSRAGKAVIVILVWPCPVGTGGVAEQTCTIFPILTVRYGTVRDKLLDVSPSVNPSDHPTAAALGSRRRMMGQLVNKCQNIYAPARPLHHDIMLSNLLQQSHSLTDRTHINATFRTRENERQTSTKTRTKKKTPAPPEASYSRKYHLHYLT